MHILQLSRLACKPSRLTITLSGLIFKLSLPIKAYNQVIKTLQISHQRLNCMKLSRHKLKPPRLILEISRFILRLSSKLYTYVIKAYIFIYPGLSLSCQGLYLSSQGSYSSSLGLCYISLYIEEYL